MASTYTTNNKLNKQGSGDNNSTWGTVLNEGVIDLVDQSLDGVVNYALSGTTTTVTIPNGTLDGSRSRCIRFNGTLSAINTITIGPNTVQKFYIVFNNTSGGFSIVIAQGGGSGSTVTVPNGHAAFVFCDGTGTNANVTTLSSMTFAGTIAAGTFSGSGASLTSIPASAFATLSHVRAVTTTAQSIPTSSMTLVQYGTEQYDTLGEYDPGTYRFTATSAGKYSVNAAAEIASFASPTGTAVSLSVYVNGALYATGPVWENQSTTGAAFAYPVTVSTTVDLGVSGYVEIFINQNTGGSRSLTTTAGKNFLTVDRLI